MHKCSKNKRCFIGIQGTLWGLGGEVWGGAVGGAHHLSEQVPVVAVELWGQVVHTQHVVCTVGEDAGAVWGPEEREPGLERQAERQD